MTQIYRSHMDYRAQVRAMPASEAVPFLLDALDVLTRVECEDVSGFRDSMTMRERRYFDALDRAGSKAITYEALFDAAYFDAHCSDLPDLKIVQVYICKMRKKLPASYRIETLPCFGYRLVKGGAA